MIDGGFFICSVLGTMLARLQKVIVLALAIFSATFALAAPLLGHPAWAGSGLLFVVLAYGLTLALQFVFLQRSSNALDVERPGILELLKAWTLETSTTPVVFLWEQPFRSRAIADFMPTSATTEPRRGVVLIHGFVCNRGFWNRWMRRLRAGGVPFIAVDLEPVFGSIDGYVPIVDRAVCAIAKSTGLPPVLVGHSMGGLAIRAWLARTGDASRYHRAVTIGSPHRGTWMARHSSSRNGREMRVGSSWLHRLEVLEKVMPPARFVCFWSRCDNIVFPSANATMPGVDNRHLETTPHVQMIHHPAVIEEVLRLVREPALA